MMYASIVVRWLYIREGYNEDKPGRGIYDNETAGAIPLRELQPCGLGSFFRGEKEPCHVAKCVNKQEGPLEIFCPGNRLTAVFNDMRRRTDVGRDKHVLLAPVPQA